MQNSGNVKKWIVYKILVPIIAVVIYFDALFYDNVVRSSISHLILFYERNETPVNLHKFPYTSKSMQIS